MVVKAGADTDGERVAGKTEQFHKEASMIQLTYQGEFEYNNAKVLVFRAVASGDYGVAGAGDLLNLAPFEEGANPTGILDPKSTYDHILQQPPGIIGILNANVGGYGACIKPNAVPTLYNFGLQFFDAVTELTTAEGYPAPILAGYVDILVGVPSQ